MVKAKNNGLIILLVLVAAFFLINQSGSESDLDGKVIVTASSTQQKITTPMVALNNWCEGYAFPDSSVNTGCQEYFDCDSGCTSCYRRAVDSSRCNGGGTTPLSGSWSNINIPSTATINQLFTVTADFTAGAAGTYYLESGVDEPTIQQATYTAQGSRCDGDVHYAGVYANLAKGEKATVTFKIMAWGSTGTKKVYVGAFKACGWENRINVNYDGRTTFISETTPQTLSGSYTYRALPVSVEAGTYFNITAGFKADVTGRYYLEGGILGATPSNTMAILAQGSKCDNNPYAAGAYLDLVAGQNIDLIFKIKATNTPGTVTTYVGAYSGCIANGGSSVATLKTDSLIISSSGGDGGGTVLSGSWSNVDFPSTVPINTLFGITADFTANVAGTYYLEAGITEPSSLQSVFAQGSKCDGNVHAAGEFVTLAAGEMTDVTFAPKTLSTTGTKQVYVGAFTKCISDGGVEVPNAVKYDYSITLEALPEPRCGDNVCNGNEDSMSCQVDCGLDNLAFSNQLRLRADSFKLPEKVKAGETFKISFNMDNINKDGAGKINVEATIIADSISNKWSASQKTQSAFKLVESIETCQPTETFADAALVKLEKAGSKDYLFIKRDQAEVTLELTAPTEDTKLGGGNVTNWDGYGDKYSIIISTYDYCAGDPDHKETVYETKTFPLTITDQSGIGGVPSLEGGLGGLSDASLNRILNSLCLEDANCESGVCAQSKQVQDRLEEDINDGFTVDSSIGKITNDIAGQVRLVGNAAILQKTKNPVVDSVCVESGQDKTGFAKLWDDLTRKLAQSFNTTQSLISILLIIVIGFIVWKAIDRN